MNKAITKMLSAFPGIPAKPANSVVLRIIYRCKEIGHKDGFMIPSEEISVVIDYIRLYHNGLNATQIIFKDGELLHVGDAPPVATYKELIASLRKHIFSKRGEAIIFTDTGKIVEIIEEK